MSSETRRTHHRHVELAQKILEIASERGMRPGDRLAEQALASLCNVSRTPIRKALQVLLERGVVTTETEGGYALSADPATMPRLEGAAESEGESDIHAAILRDLAAGRISDQQTVASLQRRYAVSRQTVQNAMMKLADENIAERAAGQQWVLKQFAVSSDAVAKSYEFRLATEPLALIMPDFKRDIPAIVSLRQSMLILRSMSEASFDQKLFERTDFDFHMLIAKSCGNPFMSEALTNHHRRRRSNPVSGHANLFRLMQFNLEHMQILEQVERGQMELAADLMRVHIQLSQSQRPRLAGRGVPPAFKLVSR
ncbi:DNA-binding GntR family transcriptional regulator [Pararhizobium capsulatum DSM 1112]|uniref:DNA-binding GntR family transcriptional regulator n=1 Tax=Pararhizobium capsulatum DSM 1112 TaxID=1121113 RepID=A0ABU0BS99_9HYPH|nr:GntR family transcriptional regulator [Pararhizobium capsulatum]MDQ0321118.1 DNA-binding GntR family transcriptional regulator [Pararhizobium capsulatum DSM 1112]